MPAKKDNAASSLAAKMSQALRQRQERGDTDRPLTLEKLARQADPVASSKTILSAILTKVFRENALAARRDVRAPVALLDDVNRLAASDALFLYALECKRTAANHAASPSELKSKLTSKLQKPFQDAVHRRLAEGSIPPGVGWVLVRNTKKLFLLSDLHTAREKGQARDEPAETSVLATPYSIPGTPYFAPPAALQEPRPPSPPTLDLDFATTFNDAFAQLDRHAGGHNFVSLVDLRRLLPVARERFDVELRELRVAGRYTLSAAEGRHGLTAAEQEGGILENGTLLLYVSRKTS